MGKPAPKTSALVVSAIRNLREIQGSTPQEIMNFITTEYGVPASTVKRKLQAALKRGLEYGILKYQHGHYRLSPDATGGGSLVTGGESGGLVEKCGRKRRKYRKCKKTRRCARGCVRNRRKRKCGGKRRHSRRSRCSKHCRTTGDEDNLALSPLDEISARRSRQSSRSTRSRTRSRSRSGHSSANRVREANNLDRREKGAE